MPGNDMNYSNNDNLKRETFKIIPISKIQDFPEHPYKVKDDENMVELVESVKTRGLIQPVLVRPLDNGMYEMVSGHRRKRAFEIAGIEKIPARVQNLTRDEDDSETVNDEVPEIPQTGDKRKFFPAVATFIVSGIALAYCVVKGKKIKKTKSK